MRFSRIISALCGFTALTALLTTPQLVYAQTQALDFTGGIFGTSSGSNSLGWEFSVSTTVTVTHLGIWDMGNDGLANSHPVGVWTSTGTLLASTTMASGTGAPAIVAGGGAGSFRYNPISSIVLTPGSYVISAGYVFTDTDMFGRTASSVSMGAGLSFTQTRFENGSGFTFPTQAVPDNAFFGPNFQYRIGGASAPEPSALALLALGGSLALVKRRTK